MKPWPIFSLLALLVSFTAANARPIKSLLEIRQDRVIIQKWETSCAAAALATVLTFTLDDPVPEKTIVKTMLRDTDPMKVKMRGGFSMLDLKRFVESRGFKGKAYKGLSIEELVELESPIVPLNNLGNPHFVVVRGLTPLGEVDIADPAFGNHMMPLETFNSSWREGLAFVASR